MADPITLENVAIGIASLLAGGSAVVGFRNIKVVFSRNVKGTNVSNGNGSNGNGYVTKDWLTGHCSAEHKTYGEALVRIEQRLEHGDKQIEALTSGISEMAANSAEVAKQIGTLTGHVEALRGK